MFEIINVIITNISKWFKSSGRKNYRRIGFYMSLIVSLLWVVYFSNHKQYCLASNSLVTIFMAVRGIGNNE